VVYGFDPLSLLDLIPRSLNKKSSANATGVKEIQKLQKQVKHKIEKSNSTYQNQAIKQTSTGRR